MPSDRQAVLREIEHNIRLAQLWTDDLDETGFEDNQLVVYAVIRCLEIISEAVRRLPADIELRQPGIPWQAIRAAGNIYRHRYDHVVERDVWDTVTKHLPALKAVIAQELDREEDS